VWIVDPAGHLVEVFSMESGRPPTLVATASDEASVRLPPFDLDLDVRRLWTSEKPE
jgi:hypothetical protein